MMENNRRIFSRITSGLISSISTSVNANLSFCIFVAALAVFLFFKMAHAPLDPWDEMSYLRIAIIHYDSSPDWAPLYVYWYRALSYVFGDDPVVLFRLGHGLVEGGTLLMVYRSVRILGGGQSLAMIGTAFLASWIPWLVEPTQVNHFHFMLVLVAWNAVVTWIKEINNQFLVLCLAFLLLCYVRQDDIVMAVGVFFCAMYFSWKAIRSTAITHPRRSFYVWIIFLFALVLILGLFSIWSPFESRGWFAFCDHYFWVTDPFNSRGEGEVVKSTFGNAASIAGAMLNNPGAFARYIFNNWANWKIDGLLGLDVFLTSALAICLSIFLVLKRKNSLFVRIKWDGPKISFLILTVLFALRTIVSVSLFESFFRYYFECVVWGGILIVSLVALHDERHRRLPFVVSLILSIGFILSSAYLNSNQHIRENMLILRRNFTDLIERLKGISPERRKSWFSSAAYPFYLGNLNAPQEYARALEGYERDETIVQWANEIRQKKYDIIIFDQSTDEPLRRWIGIRGIAILKKVLISPCYERWEANEFDDVYLRKIACRSD